MGVKSDAVTLRHVVTTVWEYGSEGVNALSFRIYVVHFLTLPLPAVGEGWGEGRVK